MALKATFLADFDSFTSACKKAEADFALMETGAQRVEKQLNKTVDAFSGRKIVQDANLVTESIARIGGASALTEREQAKVNRTVSEALEKYKALGQEAPQAMRDLEKATRKVEEITGKLPAKTADWKAQVQSLGAAIGVSLSIGAVVNFGREILQMGDDIQRTADQTGLMTGEVQRLSFIAGQSGNTLDQLTSSVGQMQNRLASGDASAVGALKQLNLTFADLANLSPYQQLERISAGVSLIPNPATRAQVAMDLFGKSGIAILPTLTSEFEKLGAAAPVMSDKTVKALDAAGDAFSELSLRAKVAAAESFNFLSGAFTKGIAAGYKEIATLFESIAGIEALVAKLPGASRAFPSMAEDIKAASAQARWFRDAARLMTEETQQTAAAVASTIVPLKQQTDHLKAGAVSHRELAKVIAETMPPSAEELRILGLLDKAHRSQAAALGVEAAAYNAAQKAAENYIKHLPTANLIGIPGTRDLSGLVPQIGGAAITGGNLAGTGTAQAQSVWASIFGSSAQLGQQLSATILGSIQGGGNPVSASAGLIGGKIGSSIAGSLTKEGGKLFSSALGGVMNSALPIVGSLVGPLAGALWNKLFGTAGRDAVEDFVAQFGGFDAFHAMLGKELPQDSERLWIALTQGVGRNNPKEAQKAIDAITAALGAQKDKTTEAAQAALDAATKQQAALDAISGKYSDAIAKLDSEYKSLSDSVAKEAAEEFMGITEMHERERMAQIKAEKAAQEAMRDAEIDAKKLVFDSMLTEGAKVDQALREMFGKPFVMGAPEWPAGSVPSHTTYGGSGSGTGTYTPPAGRPNAGGGSGSRPIVIQNQLTLNGRQLLQGLMDTVSTEGAS